MFSALFRGGQERGGRHGFFGLSVRIHGLHRRFLSQVPCTDGPSLVPFQNQHRIRIVPKKKVIVSCVRERERALGGKEGWRAGREVFLFAVGEKSKISFEKKSKKSVPWQLLLCRGRSNLRTYFV